MARALWKGAVTFGLVEIPVALHAAIAREEEVHFTLLDRDDMTPVRYERVNAATGKPVAWERIVKGYEHAKGEYVVLSEEEIRSANVEAAQTIEILDFVPASEIDCVYWDTPYYLEPVSKKKSKSYALLRETLVRTGKVGIAKVVIRTRQRLAALTVRGPVIVLDVLRYGHEIREPDGLELPQGSPADLGLSVKELAMAQRLVEGMSGAFDPTAYRDEYRDDVLALVERKVKAGKTTEVLAPAAARRPRREADVLDLMPLLEESLERRGKRVVAAERPRAARRTVRRKGA